MVIGDILVRAARKFPHNEALVCGDKVFSYRQFNQRVNRLARAILSAGLKKGDRIGVVSANSREFLELYFAAAKSGTIICPYNTMLTPEGIAGLINYSKPSLLFVQAPFVEALAGLGGSLTTVGEFVHFGGRGADWTRDYEGFFRDQPEEEPEAKVEPDDVQSIYFTSGTTGASKGAMRTHRHLLSTAVTGIVENRVTYGERVLLLTPMHHVAFEDNLGRCFFLPNTAVVYDRPFDPGQVIQTLERERISSCLMVPTMISALVHHPDIEKADLSRLKRLYYVGSPMPLELLRKSMSVLEKFGTGFCQQYGQTESGPLSTILPPEDHVADGPPEKVRRLASAGRPVLDYEVRIVGPEGEDLPPGEVGEIALRSVAIMKGYWEMEEKTAQTLRDGWLHTGDLGTFDEDGYVYLIDRKNDMIISGGENIYPREVEEVLYQHPAVREATVVGVPDDYWGETVKAVVALHKGETLSEEELREFCKGRLASYKRPKSIEIWEDLPKNATGKLLRRKVRERYWEGLDRQI